MISEEEIAEWAYDHHVYQKGVEYYHWGRVSNVQYDKERAKFTAKVQGKHPYRVTIYLDHDGNGGYGDIEEAEVISVECTCPAFIKYDGACKHIVATLKTIQGNGGSDAMPDDGKSMSQSTKELFAYFNQVSLASDLPAAEDADAKTKIIPTYHFSIHYGKKRNWIEFTIGKERSYSMKSIRAFVRALENESTIKYGKLYEFDAATDVFDAHSEKWVSFLKNVYEDEQNHASWGSSYSYGSVMDEKRLKLSQTNIKFFMESMQGEPFDMVINEIKIKNVKVVTQRPSFNLRVTATERAYKVALDLEDDVYFALDNNFEYLYHKNNVYHVDKQFAHCIAPWMKCFAENRKPEVTIPQAQFQEFLAIVVPIVQQVVNVHMDEKITVDFYSEALQIQLYLDKLGDGVVARICFQYGAFEINPCIETQSEMHLENKKLLRNTREENRFFHLLKKYGFIMRKDEMVLTGEEQVYEFITRGLPELQALSQIFYSEGFQSIGLKSIGKVSAGVKVNTGTGLLEFNMQHEEINKQELLELLSSYRVKRKYHRLKSGQFISLDTPEFTSMAELIDQLQIADDDLLHNVIELPKYRAMYIDSLVREKAGFHIERSSNFKKMVQDISEPEDMEFDIPAGIQGKLRDYQKKGFKWLKTLAHYGFGGILADDMGLGKTLQVITFVKSENEQVKMPCLVVAPTSLVYNWQEEVRKFAPDLHVVVISGAQSDRRERFPEMQQADLVVTSYGMIKRDIALYEDVTFRYCFIDEAQQIKNHNTQNAKAVKQIRATGYFALTGTPVENTLTELWSIFDFIMPGYLLSHHKFARRFETPIVKSNDAEALKELGRHIKPFIMRRMKKDVLKELPDKIESKMMVEMTTEQHKLYMGYLLKAKKEFETEMLENGFENSRIKILSILTRLRQLCCHPSLFIENYTGGSGKLEMLMELLHDAIDGGHRVLVFSQFTSMLALIRQALETQKIEYFYLDGGTSAEERMQRVQAFNEGDKAVFLISLKAGGTGLNLTGADMVIHVDPWWNPAVEDQATDRAYRMGQKKAVQVFKLITKDTIEDKIFGLQQKKKELIDAIIKPGENFLSKMTEAEIRKLFEITQE